MIKKATTPDVSARILHVARELFISKGYEGTSVRDIAVASGANVAHIKYYFNSKSHLFEIIFDEAFEVLIQRVFATLNSDMPFLELVEKWISIYYEVLPEFPQIPIFILNAINHSPDTLVEKIIKKNPREIFERLSERMEAEIAKGAIKDIPPINFGLDVLSLCIFPFIFGDFATQVARKSGSEYSLVLKEHKQHVIDFVLNALKP